MALRTVAWIEGLVYTAAFMTTRIALAVAIAVLYVLHQDLWFWGTARPLVFGFLPVGLAYHGLYCLASAVLMWALTSLAWPSHLERAGRTPER